MEQAVAVIPGVYKPKMLGRRDHYTLICTNSRTIFAVFTSQMMKDAVKEARGKASDEGKGFFGRWGAQIASTSQYHTRYWEMKPEDILNQNEQNFEIAHDVLIKLKARKKVDHSQDSFDLKTELEYETSGGKHKFLIDEYSKGTLEVLAKVYGAKLKT